MEYQKFIPEGWEETKEDLNTTFIQNAFESGQVLQGYVNECDSNYNLHLNLGNNIKGIIPRNELEGINVDDFGFCNPNICRNKVNQFVQFKVKEIYDDNNVLLSRKTVQEEALSWVKEELKPGNVVNRNSKKYEEIWSLC
ncbi:MAG: hypothetical protein IJW20_03320 [Clostridia bacterium]|nr:hypothetical protein [Clostridia bacterium]